MEKLTKGLSGLAGEYFVAGELTRRGYIVTLTLRNTKAFFCSVLLVKKLLANMKKIACLFILSLESLKN